MTAPIASGWSKNCRVGLSPTGKRRLSTAHANFGHSMRDFFNPEPILNELALNLLSDWFIVMEEEHAY